MKRVTDARGIHEIVKSLGSLQDDPGYHPLNLSSRGGATMGRYYFRPFAEASFQPAEGSQRTITPGTRLAGRRNDKRYPL